MNQVLIPLVELLTCIKATSPLLLMENFEMDPIHMYKNKPLGTYLVMCLIN